MKIERITLRDFRNVQSAEYSPGPFLNFLVGKNGQGKTTLLEAIGYLATLRSFRGSKTAEVVRWGTQQAEVACRLRSDTAPFWETDLKISFLSSDSDRARTQKIAFINGKPYRSSTQYLSQRFGNFVLGFHAVVFNPSDHDLVRSDPGTRRAYLDRALGSEDGDYLNLAQRYQKILDQRNAILRENDRPAPDLLAGFTESLIQYGSLLTLKRIQWLKRVSGPLNNVAHIIAPSQPVLRLAYLSSWTSKTDNLSKINDNLQSVHFAGQEDAPSLELLEQAFRKKQSLLEKAEWRAGHSLVGPHRDDWVFYFGDQALKGHGSQGEVRSALLALKLSEIELFRESTHHRPVFLLDDFSSELDDERRMFLLRFLADRDLQVFVTTTDENYLPKASFFPFFKTAGDGKPFRCVGVANGNLKIDKD